VVPGYSLELANFYFCLGEMYIERADESSTSPAIAKRYRKQVCAPILLKLLLFGYCC
jgi:SET and MYND domain-containing protein